VGTEVFSNATGLRAANAPMPPASRGHGPCSPSKKFSIATCHLEPAHRMLFFSTESTRIESEGAQVNPKKTAAKATSKRGGRK
jgi:hypothetical protein